MKHCSHVSQFLSVEADEIPEDLASKSPWDSLAPGTRVFRLTVLPEEQTSHVQVRFKCTHSISDLNPKPSTLEMQVDMWVALGPSYPFEASSVYLGFREVKGLLSSHIELLTAKLQAAIGTLVGREMVFELHTCAREFLTEHNVDHTTFSMHDQMVKEQEEKRVIAEREARAREQAMARELRLQEQNHMRDQKVLENEMRIAEAEREQRARELAQQEKERLRKLFGQAAKSRNRRESEEGDSDWDGDEEDAAASPGGDADGASAVAGQHKAAVPASGSSRREGSMASAAGDVASGAPAAAGPPCSESEGRKQLRWKKLITQVCLHLNPRPWTLDPGPWTLDPGPWTLGKWEKLDLAREMF